jgi:hypothetical protein
MSEMKTLSQKINELKSAGYAVDFYFENGKLNWGDNKYNPNDIEKLVEYRFEGK